MRYRVIRKSDKVLRYSGSLEECVHVCDTYKGHVVVEEKRRQVGFTITITWFKFFRPFEIKKGMGNILWVHWYFEPSMFDFIGDTVYESNNNA